MKTLRFPINQTKKIIEILGENSQFEVLEKTDGNALPATFVLLKTRPSIGHFTCAAFCVVQPVDDATVELRISHLNIQRAWHGLNMFRLFDRKIEDLIVRHIQRQLPSATS